MPTFATHLAHTLALESLLAHNPAARRRVLIADDDRIVRALARAVLAPAHVIEATNGTEAVAFAFSLRPNIIVLDRKMPGTSGLDALRLLRGHAATRTIPIIMLSALETTEDIRNGIDAGADAYLPKSQLATSLGLRVETVLARRKTQCAIHPLTKLPGPPSLRAALGDRLLTTTPFALLHINCENLGVLVAEQGCGPSTVAVRTLAATCYDLFVRLGTSDDDIAHIGGDEIVMLVDIARADALGQGLQEAMRRLYDDGTFGGGPSGVIVQVEVDPGGIGDPWELGRFVSDTKRAMFADKDSPRLERRRFAGSG